MMYNTLRHNKTWCLFTILLLAAVVVPGIQKKVTFGFQLVNSNSSKSGSSKNGSSKRASACRFQHDFLKGSVLNFNLHGNIGLGLGLASSPSPSRRTELYISNLFKNESDHKPQLPKDVKEAVSKCRQAVQKGLENKLSRMVRMIVMRTEI